MFDSFNTRNGEIGFEITLENGASYREVDYVWDEVPTGIPVTSLKLVHFPTGKVYVNFSGLDRYGFSNRASTMRLENDPVHLGKVIIGIKDDKAVVLMADFAGAVPVFNKRICDPSNTGYVDSVLRP